MANRTTTRIGAAALPLGLLVLLVAEPFHPSHEDLTDHPAVFREYAASEAWVAVHLGEYAAFLLLMGGLVGLYYAVAARPGPGTAWARFGLAAAVTAAASFTVLQAVDGIALKRAVDAWASAPADRQAASFAATEALRWTEIGVNALSYVLVGLALVLFGLALALGATYPRWVGWLAVAAGAAFLARGLVVSYRGFVPSITVVLSLVLFAPWALITAVLMWRDGGREATADDEAVRA